MKFTARTKYTLLSLLVILNVIMRFQIAQRELGFDSFLMHTMANSISEYGYAKWFLDPLSVAGLYPYSYSSAVQFFVSGIYQTTGLEMATIVFLYNVILAILALFAAYLFAGVILDDDVFRFIMAFCFSIVPAIVSYTTYTIGTRPMVIILAPLLIYLLFKKDLSVRFLFLAMLFSFLMFVSHHLFYFLFPVYALFISLVIVEKIYRRVPSLQKLLDRFDGLNPIVSLILFMMCFSVPFIFKKFLETGSRYQPLLIDYLRYTGPLIIFSVGGLLYMIFKERKSIHEWILLLSTISMVTFIYEPTYMKWFLPILLVPLGCLGLMNLFNVTKDGKWTGKLVPVILLLLLSFSGYYQFVHDYGYEDYYNGRYIEDSVYGAGIWLSEYGEGNAISNDRVFSYRMGAYSGEVHFLIPYTIVDMVYGFIEPDLSLYERYPLTSEEFWFNGYNGPDEGETLWLDTHRLYEDIKGMGINLVVEQTRSNGNLVWHHQKTPSKLLAYAQDRDLIYDSGNVNVWKIY